jgi:hypothetical protein
MIFSCLPCLTRYRFISIRPRRIHRHHRKRLYDDVRDIDTLPLPNPIFVPPSPPPPEPGLPLALIPLPTPEEPLRPFPLVHYRPRSISPPPVPVHGQLPPYSVFDPHTEPVIYREPVPYPEPILYLEPIHHHELLPRQNITLNYLPTMIGGYGGYLRPDDIPTAVELAVELILSELRSNDWRERFQPFRNGYINRETRIGNLEIEEYIRR